MRAVDMRTYVTKAYPGERWKNKVKKMPDAQVTAIYFRLKAKEEKENASSEYVQISLF